ncbi:(2Fe-2S)-binding protein [Vibrio sp.]|uniref:(2Fe-2S)-binding protein n=1 Tax=Vibrio sp. TaxID=678 RepID=UPI003D10BE48
MFKDVSQHHHTLVNISINEEAVQVPTGYTVAAAILANGCNSNRSSLVSGKQRGPYCMMGVCFECLVEIDGVPNQQGCMTEIAEGMAIRFQNSDHQMQASGSE